MNVLSVAVLSLVITGEAEIYQGAWHGTRMAFEAWRCGSAMQSAWRASDGRVVAEEELAFDGERWVRYRLHRPNVALEVVARREADGVRLTIRQGSDTRQVSLRSAGELIAGPTLVTHLAGSLPRLRAGKTAEFDYLVADHGMVLRLRAKSTGGAVGGIASIRLEAASPLLRPFVPPTTLQFDERGELLSMSGRLVPQAGDVKNPQSLEGVLRIRPVTLAANAPRMQYSCHKGDVS